MEYESRTKRFKYIHDKVNREIAKSTILNQNNEQLNAVMEKLDAVDLKFFREKMNDFMKEQQLSKPYLESDKKSVTITDDEVIELKKILNELKKVEPTSSNVEKTDENPSEDDELQGELFSPENVELRNRLKEIIDWLNAKIENYNSHEIKKVDLIENLKMQQVQRLRNRDPREIGDLAKDIANSEATVDLQRRRANLNVTSTKQLRFVKIVLPILIVLLALVAVGIALVIVL